MNIAIIKYNAGNVQSIQYALKRLGFEATITDVHSELLQADKVIFPGVGNAFSAMESLKEKQLDQLIRTLKQPVLGICVGMQLLCRDSEENNTTGLGIMPLSVKKFIPPDQQSKIPHMGWNTISDLNSKLLSGINENAYVYYVHSYYVELGTATIATTNYIHPFSAAISHNNFYGVQFHTEKSAAIGDQILLNFLKNIQ